MKKEKQWRCFYEVWRATFWNWQEKKKKARAKETKFAREMLLS